MRWMWIDTIIDYEPDTRLVAVKNISLAEEHLHDHFAADDTHPSALPVMPASFIIEGMAQTSGILVGTVNRFREKVILAKVVKTTLPHDAVPGETLRYTATLDNISPQGASTSGVIHKRAATESDWQEFGRIDLMFSHIDQNITGLEFPEHNFVFSDNFKTLLDNAGLAHLAD